MPAALVSVPNRYLHSPVETISLNDAYELSYKHAVQMIRRGGGQVDDDSVTIRIQTPNTVPFEDAFENHVAQERRRLTVPNGDQPVVLSDTYSFDFDGVGFALLGTASTEGEDHVFTAELYVDGELVETAEWPTAFTTRRFYLFWKYALPDGEHEAEVRLVNPTDHAQVTLEALVVYGAESADTPVGG